MSFESQVSALATAIGTTVKGKISSTEKGAVNGVATLDGAGKLTASQLPASAIGGMIYQGIWNASTNSPAIPASAVGNKGHYYKVSVAGSTTIDTINDWKVGDWIVSNGSVWDKIDNTDQVSTVAGRTGAVVLGTSDIAGLDTTLGTIVTANATTSTSGLMSSTDKTKLEGVATNANNYTLPNASDTVTGGVKLSSATVQGTASNAVTSTASRTYGVQVDGTGKAVVNVPWVDTVTTYVVATTGANGLMSSTDKTKLDGVATGANNYVHPTGDGNLHVPATSTTNNGKVLMAGATAGTLNWATLEISNTTGLQTALDAKATTTSVTTLSNNVGATDTNYVTVFNAALA